MISEWCEWDILPVAAMVTPSVTCGDSSLGEGAFGSCAGRIAMCSEDISFAMPSQSSAMTALPEGEPRGGVPMA